MTLIEFLRGTVITDRWKIGNNCVAPVRDAWMVSHDPEGDGLALGRPLRDGAAMSIPTPDDRMDPTPVNQGALLRAAEALDPLAHPSAEEHARIADVVIAALNEAPKHG
jgi:hypothetical protein